MINLTTATNFLKKLKEYVPYEMMLIDINGVVMAAPDLSERGKVCEIAVQLNKSAQERIYVEQGDANNLNGFECGVYLSLKVNRQKAGVLVILGEVEKLFSIAGVAKLCVEKMWEMELMKQNYSRNSEQHIQRLIYNSELSKEDLEYLVRINHIKSEIPRVPILYVVHSVDENGEVICRYDADALKVHIYNSGFYGTRDLICCTLDNNVIQFKAIDPQKAVGFIAEENEMREQIEAMMEPLQNTIFSAYVGPIQKRLQSYSMAYKMCEWLRVVTCERGVYYFTDSLFNYLSNRLSKGEYEAIFSAIVSEMDEGTINNFCEMMEALIACDFNLLQAAKKLYIHKNTAMYRFDKIRDLLGINPLSNNNERLYIEMLYHYIKNI